MECTHDTEDQVQFKPPKLSKEFTVRYRKTTMKDDVLAIIEVIRWFFEKVLSPPATNSRNFFALKTKVSKSNSVRR